jgi:hypothetical protein
MDNTKRVDGVVESRHTPLPWKLAAGCLIHIQPLAVEFECIAHLSTGELAFANAELIVRAVNSHGEFLAACKASMTLAAMRDCYCADLDRKYMIKHGNDCGPCMVRAAIAKVEGNTQPICHPNDT